MRIKKDAADELEFRVTYMGEIFTLKSQNQVKINGILLQQDEDHMRSENIKEIVKKMAKKLEPWSKRSLSLIGKILITKTFGLSQIIYIMQCFPLEPEHFKMLNGVLYKFIWNKHFKAAKAPERINREIINKRIALGGFGMLDLITMDRSIKLKALGRMLTTSHPFTLKVRETFDNSVYFFPSLTKNICRFIMKAVDLLRQDRQHTLKDIGLRNNVKLLCLIKETPIKKILNANGLNSLRVMQLRLAGITKLGHLDGQKLDQLRRLIALKDFIPWVQAGFNLRAQPLVPSDYVTIWGKDRYHYLTELTTKEIRELKESMRPIEDFKIGLNLSVAESLTWCHRIRKLTSVRHQSSLLRAAHGDTYTKDRLMRFGLSDNDRCDRCGGSDSRLHRLVKCPKALELWNLIRGLDNKEALDEDSPNLIKEIFGVTNPIGSEISIHAEIIQTLVNTLDTKLQTLPARITARIILTKLFNLEKGTTKENVKTLLEQLD